MSVLPPAPPPLFSGLPCPLLSVYCSPTLSPFYVCIVSLACTGCCVCDLTPDLCLIFQLCFRSEPGEQRDPAPRVRKSPARNSHPWAPAKDTPWGGEGAVLKGRTAVRNEQPMTTNEKKAYKTVFLYAGISLVDFKWDDFIGWFK